MLLHASGTWGVARQASRGCSLTGTSRKLLDRFSRGARVGEPECSRSTVYPAKLRILQTASPYRNEGYRYQTAPYTI
jgi:hypothetical protein